LCFYYVGGFTSTYFANNIFYPLDLTQALSHFNIFTETFTLNEYIYFTAICKHSYSE